MLKLYYSVYMSYMVMYLYKDLGLKLNCTILQCT